MHKLLIPLFICLTATLSHAQVPKNISISSNHILTNTNSSAPDAACSAGTFTLGQFIGQSNDYDLDTVYLCLGDSLFIDHNGDQMFMDPDPTTPPAVGYAFYNCMPSATGDLPTVLTDPCVWPGAANGLWIATGNGQCDGDIWFFNNGALINSATFGNMNPVQIMFAPITLDNCQIQGFEGGCVDVNTAAKFSVVYLKAITESGVSNNYNNDCIGKFTLRGGYPEWDLNATYTVSITLASDPNVKALIYTPPAQMKHQNVVIFSVPQAGVYDVVIEDGKSCGRTFQMNMNVCNPTDNVEIGLPELVSPPNTQICVPISMQNFTSIFGTSFSLSWDPTVLQFDTINNPHPSLGPFDIPTNLNIQNVGQGFLGIAYYDNSPVPQGATIPNGETMVEICFNVIGPLNSCSPLDIVSFPTLVTMDNTQGVSLAVSVDTGQVCADLIPLNIQFGMAPPNCTDASFSVIIEGGTAPYEITWTNLATGSTGFNVSNVADTILTSTPQPEGDYRVCVADQNGFGVPVCDTVTIDIPTLGATLVLVQSPTCNGNMDGAIRAEVSIDGVVLPPPSGANFTYNWSPATLPAVQEHFNVKAGNYAVTVTDTSNGCTQIAAGSLTEPAAINATNIQVTQASCPGVADGCIEVTVTGGTPFANNEYFFTWEYSPNASGTPLFTDESGSANPFNMCNKPAGYYFLTITDANGCTHTEEVQLTYLREVTVDLLNQIDPTCAGLATGSLEVEMNAQPAFNNPDYLFFWTSIPPAGPYPQVNNGNNSILSSLPAGNYQVLALEITTGCSDTATFTLTNPPALDVVATPKNPGCLLQNDGSVVAVGTGGTGGPNYTYTWASNPVVVIPPGPNPTGLSAGVYTVSVTDANGCVDSAKVTLQLPPPPAITAVDSSSVKCGGDGSLTVTAPTATSFAWATLSGNPIGNTATITGLPGDTYIVTIKDAQSCTNTDTFTLAPVIPMSFADTSFIEPVCFNGTDGTISIQVQGGSPGPGGTYAYLWSSSQNTPTLFGIKANTYTVTVTDLKQCTLTGTFKLNNPPSINVSSAVTMNRVSCPGVCDGAATLTVSYIDSSGASIPGNFNFTWSDNGPADSVRTDFCAGTTMVTVTDGNNCFLESLVSIDDVPAIQANATLTPITCYGGADGAASVSASGGNGTPYTYLWDTGSTLPQVTGLTVGDHTVVITDKNNCKDTITVMITQPTEIVITTELDEVDCFGTNTGGIEASATGGNPGVFTFQWSDSNNNNLGIKNPIDQLFAGTYNVTATDALGCTGIQLNINLPDPPAIQGIIQPWEELLCHGDETTLVIDTIFGGAGDPYRYSLDNGVYLDKDFPVTMGGGEHTVTFIDRNQCEYTDTITVIEPEQIVVTFDSLEIEIELGDTTRQLFPIVSGAVVDTFVWTPSEFLHYATDFEPFVYTFGSQTYTIVVYDEKGCSATGSIRVNVDPNRNVYIPNAFKPVNPTGLNYTFNPAVGLGVEIINYMRVFDRWGNLMYERNSFMPSDTDFSDGWDGKYRGEFVNPGVFVYAIEVKFLDGRVLLYRGDVTVVR